MADDRRREYERRFKETGAATDETAWLLERLRHGAIDVGRVELAAALDHEPAVTALGSAPRSGWASFRRALLAPPTPSNEEAFLRAVTEEGRTVEGRSRLAATTKPVSGRVREREIQFVRGAGFVVGPETTGREFSFFREPIDPRPGRSKILALGDKFLVGFEVFRVERLDGLTPHEASAPSREAQPEPPPGHELPLDAVRAASWLSELKARVSALMAEVSVAFQIAVVRASGATDANAELTALETHLARGTFTQEVHNDVLRSMRPSTGACFILSDEQEEQLRRDDADWERANPGGALLSSLQYEMQDIDRGSFALARALPHLRTVGLAGLRKAVLPWLLA